MKIKVICNNCNKVQVIEGNDAQCVCGGTSFTFVDFAEVGQTAGSIEPK